MAGMAAGADGAFGACRVDSAGSSAMVGSDRAVGAVMAGSDIELLGEADDSAGGLPRLAG